MEDGGMSDMYCLESANYPGHLTAGLIGLLEDKDCSLTDVTLSCEGQFIHAHRVVLALSSPLFKEFFKINQINNKTGGNCWILLANVKFRDLKTIVQFMYKGKITISGDELGSFLAAAKMLQIQDLATEITYQANFEHSERLHNNSEGNGGIPDDGPHPKVTDSYTLGSLGAISTRQGRRSHIPERADLASSSGVSTSVGPLQVPAAINISQQPSLSAVPAVVRRQEQNSSSIGDSQPTDYDPLGDEQAMNEDSSEEMINLDAVKPEYIEVYQQSFESSENVTEQIVVTGTSGNGMIGYSSYESMQTGSATGQVAGPSSAMNPPHLTRVINGPSSSKTTKPTGEDYLKSLLSPRNQMTIQCKFCNVMMSQEQYNYPTHDCVRSKATGVVDPVRCDLCFKTFKNSKSLKVHKSNYHRKARDQGLSVLPISSGKRLADLVDVYPGTPTSIFPES